MMMRWRLPHAPCAHAADVGLYGSRWSLIRAHMQAAFQVAFPSKYLEKRWEQLADQAAATAAPLQSERSPLVDASDEAVKSTACAVSNGVGIQERLPLKRRNDGGCNSPSQPPRPPPPPSPRVAPKELLCRRCPTFLLAPGSALSAPDAVRRQLKAVYLASKLNEERWAVHRKRQNLENDSGDDGDAAVDTHPTSFASDEEKGAIVALLARELASFQKRDGSSRDTISTSFQMKQAGPKPCFGGAASPTGSLESPPSPVATRLGVH